MTVLRAKNIVVAHNCHHVTIRAINMDNSTSLSGASLSTPVSTAVSRRITPVIYKVAVGTKSIVSALPNVVTSSTSPSPDNGSLKTATVSPSVTSALIQ